MSSSRRVPRPRAVAVAAIRMITRLSVWQRYRVSFDGAETANAAEPPFFLIANHVGFWDPFLINLPIRHVIQYVTSDNIFRTRFFGGVMRLVGSIPKTKFMADARAVATIMRVIRSGGVIGIFPEGRRSWDGRSIDPAPEVARLIKHAELPVYVAVIRGLYLSKPRWARSVRRGRVHISYSRLFEAREIGSLSAEEVHAAVERAIAFDEMAAQRQDPVAFVGPRRAEYVERLLFLCPRCEKLETIRSAGHRFSCTACGADWEYGVDGFLRRADGGSTEYDTLATWNAWQTVALGRILRTWRPELPVTSGDADVFVGYRDQPLKLVGTGRVALYPRKIELSMDGASGRRSVPSIGSSLALVECEGANVQNKEKLEFYYHRTLIRVDFHDPRAPTYLWFRTIHSAVGGQISL